MGKILRPMLARLLALVLVLGMIPTAALAANGTGTYIVAGTANLCGEAWDTSGSYNVMTHIGGGIYTMVYDDVAPNDAANRYAFKVSTTGWGQSWGDQGQDYTFDVSATCDVTITFNANNGAVSATGDNVKKYIGLDITTMRAVGNGSGTWLNGANWDAAADANLMTEVSDNVYAITFEDVPAKTDYEFKFAANGGWTDNWGGSNNVANHDGGNIPLSISYELADVTLTLDLSGYNHTAKSGGVYSVTVKDASGGGGGGEEPDPVTPVDPTYIVAGDVDLCSVAWDPAATANKMTDDNDDGIWTKVYENVGEGVYRLKVTNGKSNWEKSWGADAQGSNYVFSVAQACDVTVSFTPATEAISVTGSVAGSVKQETSLTVSAMSVVCDGTESTGWLGGVQTSAMTKGTGDVYEITIEDVAAGEYKFKFAADGTLHTWGANSGKAGEALHNSQTSFTVNVSDTLTDAKVTLKLDLTGYNHASGEGAKYSAAVTDGSGTPAPVDYYLIGHLNSTDYDGFDYKFNNGTYSTSFTSSTYVYVKDSNGKVYMTDGWLGSSVTEAKLYEPSTLTSGNSGDKLQVPTGVDLVFTLVENGDGTLTLSYAVNTDTPEIPANYNKVTIHFLKPTSWGDIVNAWIWDANGKIPNYEDYNTTWPGKAIPANAEKAGWYDITVGTATPQPFNFIFSTGTGSPQTDDLSTGEITGNTELWVVDGTVHRTAPIEWTHCTATIHFQKPDAWGSTVNAYTWTDTEKPADLPGTAAEASATNPGWHTAAIQVEIGKSLGYYFGDGTDANETGDLDAGQLTGNVELWVDSSGQVVTKPAGWIDENRTIHLPGTIGNNNWNAAGNEMEYDATRGLYTITFEDVTPGTYYYKVAVNGGWGENYGANGEAGGDDMSVNVPAKQDVTFWYNDSSHRVVCSVDYDIDAVITLSGTNIPEGTRLLDPELDGQYSVTVDLDARTYDDLTITYGATEVEFSEFTLGSAKSVTFYYDPATGLAYHNGSDVKVDPTKLYYTTKDLEYKDPFGAVAVGEEVTFSIDTGTDATGVALAIRGLSSVKMVKDGEPVNGVQRWTCTTTFPAIGEYKYYFAITNGSDMVFYCDDTWNAYYKRGDYGEGAPGNPDDIFAYDLVVYEAGYETPDWMKNAVIYQIFPDRFFDGDETNNQAQTTARGAVKYEYIANWYTWPENPEQLNNAGYPANAHRGDGEWSNEIYGGDLEGIVDKIDYLKALGVNVIYLNPVFSSISNHRYDACDYMAIDPILGTLGDFEELVEVAEANDMHIILDGVFNHVSDDSVYFDRYYKFLEDAAEKYDGKIGAYPYWAYVYDYVDEHSVSQTEAEAAAKTYFTNTYGITDWSYTEWFRVSSTPMTGVVDNIGLRAGKEVYSYEGWWGYDSMPIIYSTNGSEYQTGNWAQEIIDDGSADTKDSVTEYWINKGMDGWRLDVANEVSDETWQKFRESVKAADPNAVIIGEIWSDSIHYLMGDMYDSVMNYVFRDAVAGFARGYLINRDDKTQKHDPDLTADEAMTILEILRERYPAEAFYAMMNLVGSHDTARILSYLDDVEDDRYQKDIENAFPTYEGTDAHAKGLQHVVAFLQFTYAGAPTIYYGDEIGMVGGDDPDDRRAFEWGKGNQELVEWYAKLAAIRAAYPALRTGSVEPFSTGDDDVMGFVRSDDANTVVVLANRAASDKTIAYEGTWVDLISGSTYTDTVTVPAYRGVILVAEDEATEITVNTEDLAAAHDEAYIVDVRDGSDDGPAVSPPVFIPTPPATEAVTVPISGDENTIHVGASVTGDKATVDEVDLTKLDTVIGEEVATGVVTIDFSGLNTDKPITTVEIPAEVVKEIAAAVSDPANDAESLEIVLSDGSSIEFDAVALGEKAAQADGLDITIAILHVEDIEPTAAQQEAVGDRPAFDITVTSGGKHISDMGGKVTVHAPYELREGENPHGIVVWYVDENGNKEACETSYDSERKRVNWKTDHLSLYMIGYDEALGASCPKDETCPMHPFTDVDINGWYHDGIHYCIENGLMIGTGGTGFEPHGLTTRGTIVTILHRLEGEPEVTTTGTFTDVADGLWYTEAVEWAAANGIVEGDGESFYPEANLTREQMATILHRYAQYKGIDVAAGEDTNILSFGDVGEVSEWAYPALQWACAVGLYQGDDNGLLRPGADLERCEMATLIYRLCENILK